MQLKNQKISYTKFDTTPNVVAKTKNELDISQVDSMSHDDIVGTLKNYMSFDESLVPRDMSVHTFTKKLIDIAIGTDSKLVDIPNHNHNNLNFSADINSTSTTTNFDTNSTKIYAKFDTKAFPDGKVLVKWKKNDGELLYMDFYNVKKNSEDNFIWMKQPNGWAKGKYDIDIYSPSNQLDKIYSSSYSVN